MASMNPHSRPCAVSRVALLAAGSVFSGLVLSGAAQTPSPFQGPVCAVPPPAPGTDPWPVAATVSLGNTTSPLPVTFTRDMLLANDRATTPVSLVRVAATSSGGGTITGVGPFVYTPAPLFTGTDIFTYAIRDDLGEAATGVVKVVVNPDVAAPTVAITSPANAGTVSGMVTMTSIARDNVGVVGVKFFDGLAQIGAEVSTAPFTASWDSRLVADGSHTLTAVARDAAGNIATSAAIVVNVVNTLSR